ncbi:MAG TPA: ribulose-phosphate 3-epimerase [Trueperaceae bacterium]|nr:ribulose-phosphate 3-epimerase [Trueperaceae bacterium]
MSSFLLAPSLLAADFAKLGRCVQEAQQAGADYLHLDVMDGRFVPNISFGAAVVAAARQATSLPLDVHLMIEQPERYVEQFAAAGADVITVHAEATWHLHRLLQQVRESGAKVGLALNPLTPLAVMEGALPYLDLALVMSVNPGFGGQEFIQASLGRLEAVRRMRDRINPNCLIEVDGGITPTTIASAVYSGADVVVAGSAVFGSMGSVAENVARLRDAVAPKLS